MGADTTLAERINTELDRREALAQKVDDDEWHEADMLQRWRSFSPADAEFIAASSPPVVLAYLAAFRTITGLHPPEVYEPGIVRCLECGDKWPCPTLLAVAAALGLDHE